ncbi:MAG: hypothetical protein ACRDQ4_27330, partial [Pseudonocardiaceae bacterium]
SATVELITKKEINRNALTSLHALLPGIAAVHRCSRDFAGALALPSPEDAFSGLSGVNQVPITR